MRLDHYSIRTPRLDETRRFYADILDMHEGPRPPFPFPGAWMYSGDTAMVHLVGYDPNDAEGLKSYLGDKGTSSDGTGTIDHVAFAVTGLDATLTRLRAAKLAFRERTVPNLGLHQVFVEDPNGVTLELNFPAAEAPSA
jgi:catechol 2,3-dioxygenase-like lactoylglutathione lyase family enzyme